MISIKKKKRSKPSLNLSRPSNILIILAAVLTIAVSAYLFINRTVVEEVSYEQCIKSYGDVVDQWEGEGSDLLDESGYFYRTMSFSLRADSPSTFWPNTAELEPTRISTGGEDACGDFDEQIDTVSNKYRWEGARSVGLYFGGRGFSKDSSNFLHQPHKREDRPYLYTPVYNNSIGAQAWVDDGGSALVDDDILWCVNDIDCSPVSEVTGDSRVRGSGYLHTLESCPDGYECSDEWFDEDVIESRISNGLVNPFDLRLSALSTYAPKIGTEKLLTFRYPMELELDADLAFDDSPVVEPGKEAAFSLDIKRKGRYLDSIALSVDSDDSQIEKLSYSDNIKESIDSINLNEEAGLEFSAKISQLVDKGACYEETISIKATYGNDMETSDTVLLSYCIEQPDTTYTYEVMARGDTLGDLEQFSEIINDTLSDGRGWTRANVGFEEVESGADFTMWLAAPGEMTGFSSLCSPEYSCRVLDDVIVNDERWRSATEPWNQAGGSLLDYRRMVINHEVGHFLGHGHYHCRENGNLAPVMQQQSIDLEGCQFNPWPLQFEIDAT